LPVAFKGQRQFGTQERFLGVSNGILPKAGLIKPRKNTKRFLKAKASFNEGSLSAP
jgi:hypothetical protein